LSNDYQLLYATYNNRSTLEQTEALQKKLYWISQFIKLAKKNAAVEVNMKT
jgi:hypothetical protein